MPPFAKVVKTKYTVSYRIEGRLQRQIQVEVENMPDLTDATRAEIARILAEEHKCHRIDVDLLVVIGPKGNVWDSGDAKPEQPKKPSIDEINKMTKAKLMDAATGLGIEVDFQAIKAEELRQLVVEHVLGTAGGKSGDEAGEGETEK